MKNPLLLQFRLVWLKYCFDKAEARWDRWRLNIFSRNPSNL